MARDTAGTGRIRGPLFEGAAEEVKGMGYEDGAARLRQCMMTLRF